MLAADNAATRKIPNCASFPKVADGPFQNQRLKKPPHVTTDWVATDWTKPGVRLRIIISAAIGVVSAVYCWFLLAHFSLGAGDFNWAIWAAQDLLAHRNPYQRPMQLYPI